MYLKTDSLVIRDATENDARILCNWWNDGAVMAHAGFPNGLRTNIDKIIRQLNNVNDTKQRLIIENDSMPIGEMSCQMVSENTAAIGIKICDFTMQNKGLGTIILTMLINHLFKNTGCEKIILDTNVNNKRAQHVYEKLGFKQIEIRFNSWKNQLGELQSSIDYELTANNFYSSSLNKSLT